MKLIKSKKGISFLLIVAIAAISAVGALAYWTTGGTGSGTATAGTSVAFTVTQLAPAPTNLVPGGPAQDVKINVENTQSYNQFLTSLTFVVDPAWTAQANLAKPACSAADYTLVQPAGPFGDLTPGNHFGATYTGTIALDNELTNQDNCKSVIAPLILTAA